VNPLATLAFDEQEGFQVASLEGEIDLSNAADLLARLLAGVSNRSHSVILDLTETSYLDSAGVRLVFEARRALAERRQRLRVVAPPNTFVADVLDATGLGDAITIHRSLADALDAASRPAAQG
jgi:anti-sigma B factor antagonist